jgi:hypothetical protein
VQPVHFAWGDWTRDTGHVPDDPLYDPDRMVFEDIELDED